MLSRLRSFCRSERGSVAVMFATVAVPTIIAVGVSADLMRAYSVKTRLGAALDAAALAAGANNGSATQLQTLASSYLAANFPTANGVTLDPPTYNLTSDPVTISATAHVPTTFLQLAGINTVAVGASTSVVREMRGLEVALVLDNTGSLQVYSANGVTNIEALKSAAGKLAIQLFSGQPSDNPYLRVAVVPYVAAVNPGPVAAAMVKTPPSLTPDTAAGWTGCVVERPSTFQNFSTAPNYGAVAADLDSPVTTAGYLTAYDWASDNYNVWTTRTVKSMTWTSGNSGPGPNRSCPSPVVPLVNSLQPILTAIGATSSGAYIDNQGMEGWLDGGTIGSIGMAWGYRVLSPNGPYQNIGNITVNNYNNGTTVTNVPTFNPNPWVTQNWKKVVVLMTDGVNNINLYSKYGTTYGHYTGFGVWKSNYTVSLIDAQEEAVCDALRSQGVTIYSVFLNSNSTPGPAISYCAGTQVGKGDPNYFFNANDQSALFQAFNTIGDQLSNLRISQ